MIFGIAISVATEVEEKWNADEISSSKFRMSLFPMQTLPYTWEHVLCSALTSRFNNVMCVISNNIMVQTFALCVFYAVWLWSFSIEKNTQLRIIAAQLLPNVRWLLTSAGRCGNKQYLIGKYVKHRGLSQIPHIPVRCDSTAAKIPLSARCKWCKMLSKILI